MRVLVLHNRYRSANPSGENAVVDAEVEEMQQRVDVEVRALTPSSDEIAAMGTVGKLGVAVGHIWNFEGVKRVRLEIDEFRPDVIHVHNVSPLFSPASLRAALNRGVAVVQTVHNYRHTCLNGLHFRDGKPCDLCVGRRLPFRGVQFGCYRGSRAQSVPVAIGHAVHLDTWRRVHRYFTLTTFMRDRLLATGIDPSRVEVRPTWAPDPGPPSGLGANVLFVGRLEEAKGVHLLLEAWRRAGAKGRLRIVGTGPLLDQLRVTARDIENVDFLGALAAGELHREYRDAALVVIPSAWYEGQPRVLVEAWSHGRPVLASAHGSLGASVDETVGRTCAPEVEAISLELRRLMADVGERSVMAGNARTHYERFHTPDVAMRQLFEGYQRAVRARREGQQLPAGG
jgi:glycosyltransferase involved in cell wall biosynthesis